MSAILLTMSANASAKAELRSEVRALLDTTPSDVLKNASAKISRAISPVSGTNCALFAGTSREPQLLSLLDHSDARWFLPRVIGPGLMTFHQVTSKTPLSKGAFGILEPSTDAPELSPEDLDLILCPGLAFSTSGLRLGQGGGYYDRYLTKASRAKLVGIAFDLQVRNSIPGDPHDISMHEIISESRHLTISTPEQQD